MLFGGSTNCTMLWKYQYLILPGSSLGMLNKEFSGILVFPKEIISAYHERHAGKTL